MINQSEILYGKISIAGKPISTEGGLPKGGTAKQILQKKSEKDYDAEWVDNTGSISGDYATKEYVDNAVENVEAELTEYATEKYVDNKIDSISIPTKVSELENDKGYLTEHQDISNLATKEEVTTVENKIPTKTSQLTNDSNFLTEHQSLTNYYTKEETDTNISNYHDSTKQDTLIAGENITIEDNVISSTGGSGGSYTFTNGLTETDGTVSWDLNDYITKCDGSIGIGEKEWYSKVTGKYNITNSYFPTINGNNNAVFSRDNTTCVGDSNIMMGGNELYGNYSFVVGGNNKLGYKNSPENSMFCIGSNSTVTGSDALAIGEHVIANGSHSFVSGTYNVADSGGGWTKGEYIHIVGNGTSNSARSNAYTLDWTGNGTFAGTVSSATGADYAEYFEWQDGNTNNEDRIGYIVCLDGDKIKLANSDDDILGICSGTAAVMGDTAEWNWSKRYLTDDFGRIKYREYDVTHDAEIDSEGNVISEEWTEHIIEPIENPEYDSTKPYEKRENRPEWQIVGMMGKLYVRDDGTCEVNGYVKADKGIATKSDTKTNIRVMERINDNVIRVLLK